MISSPFIVQHAEFLKSERKGIDGILQFAYMGSSEYEWGAIPKSLERIRVIKSSYTIEDFTIKGKGVTVYAPKNKMAEIKSAIKNISEPTYKLLERSLFDDYINGTEKDFHTADFWWDLENDFMFWKKDKDFEQSFTGVI